MKAPFTVVGWNCASLVKVTNKTMMNAYLEKDKPDIVMLNECGNVQDKKIL